MPEPAGLTVGPGTEVEVPGDESNIAAETLAAQEGTPVEAAVVMGTGSRVGVA